MTSAVNSRLESLRKALDQSFDAETAQNNVVGSVPSVGHCAAVALIVKNLVGGEVVSAIVEGKSHWFNRLEVDNEFIDVDLTGDQFGGPPIQIAPKDQLYEGAIVRFSSDVDFDTKNRTKKLMDKLSKHGYTFDGKIL